MIVCVTLDNNNGMMFNNRRQSQDSLLRKDIIDHCNGSRLWMNTYSEMLFDKSDDVDVVIDNEFLQKAEENDYCFVETNNLQDYETRISKIILYRWNRDYPADLYFEIDLNNWILSSSSDFAGSSHEKITKEVWIRNV